MKKTFDKARLGLVVILILGALLIGHMWWVFFCPPGYTAQAGTAAMMLRGAGETPSKQPTYVIKDVRIFLNSIRRQLGIMQRAGVDAAVEREDTEDEIRMVIRIPRRKTGQP